MLFKEINLHINLISKFQANKCLMSLLNIMIKHMDKALQFRLMDRLSLSSSNLCLNLANLVNLVKFISE
jgi:hypothetical protein